MINLPHHLSSALRLSILRTATLIGLCALGLAACTGGTATPTTEVQILQAGRENIARRTAEKQERPPLTRAALSTVEVSAMEVIIEHTETEAYVFLDDTLRDSSPGLIRVWRSQDGAQISTRNGIIINTRGLGGDVMSAEVPVSSDGAGPSHSGAQTLQVRAGANTVWPAALTCDLVDLGPRTIEIVELQYATRHLRQTCEAHANETQGVVINDYWVDSGRGIVWQSRQWAGPQLGYIRLRRLVD